MRYRSFESIAHEMLTNEKFLRLSHESHHGITRLDHSLNVARKVYKYAIKFNLDYVSATRGAIVHDFFTNAEFLSNHGLIQGVVHPDIALANAKGEFEINDIEANMIESHMFPLSVVTPKSKEAWLLTGVDKLQAIIEYASYKFNYHKATDKLSYTLGCVFLFMFFMITKGGE
ncbi:MAG: phosphohydrolase [Bacilli bacterium]|nr:phosphohydrolase [Bacilli bacterium]